MYYKIRYKGNYILQETSVIIFKGVNGVSMPEHGHGDEPYGCRTVGSDVRAVHSIHSVVVLVRSEKHFHWLRS